MWNRLIQDRLSALVRQFPAVMILGPRQVGKTTLAQLAFPKAPYLDLEQAMRDVDAKTGWILDQAAGSDILRPGLSRRSFTIDPEWLP
jgi:hypothetical protein